MKALFINPEFPDIYWSFRAIRGKALRLSATGIVNRFRFIAGSMGTPAHRPEYRDVENF